MSDIFSKGVYWQESSDTTHIAIKVGHRLSFIRFRGQNGSFVLVSVPALVLSGSL